MAMAIKIKEEKLTFELGIEEALEAAKKTETFSVIHNYWKFAKFFYKEVRQISENGDVLKMMSTLNAKVHYDWRSEKLLLGGSPKISLKPDNWMNKPVMDKIEKNTLMGGGIVFHIRFNERSFYWKLITKEQSFSKDVDALNAYFKKNMRLKINKINAETTRKQAAGYLNSDYQSWSEMLDGTRLSFIYHSIDKTPLTCFYTALLSAESKAHFNKYLEELPESNIYIDCGVDNSIFTRNIHSREMIEMWQLKQRSQASQYIKWDVSLLSLGVFCNILNMTSLGQDTVIKKNNSEASALRIEDVFNHVKDGFNSIESMLVSMMSDQQVYDQLMTISTVSDQYLFSQKAFEWIDKGCSGLPIKIQ